jgi:diaminohydroxyphosphoribosylaminopyrimidine deaminase/5-amino-6-(5-phosphoribosylamino)uracil reductase
LTIKQNNCFLKTATNINKENLIFDIVDFEKNIASQVADAIYKHQIQSVIIEGGRQTLQTFMLIYG